MELRSQFRLGNFEIRINWFIAVFVLLAVGGLARLGLWQLDRAAEKVTAQQELQARLQNTAARIEDLPAGTLIPENPELQNRYVEMQGEYLNDRTILVLAEFFDGQIGYGVVTPLRLAQNGQLVLVNRGWTSGLLPAGEEPVTRPVDGPVTVGGQIFVPPEDRRILSSSIDATQWPLRMRSLEIDVISEILGEPIFPFEVRINADQPGALVRHWPAVVADVNQNLSYAIQWFSFAFIILFISILASSNLWSLFKGPGKP